MQLNAVLSEESASFLDEFRKLIKERVIFSQNVQLLEQKGKLMIREIFTKLKEAPDRYLPEDTRRKCVVPQGNGEENYRIICDYVAGMTDEYSCKIYQMMFLPGYGSVFNRL